MNDAAYNAWQFVSLSPLPAWALIAVGCFLLASLVSAQLGLRHEKSRSHRYALLALRALGALGVLFLILEPGVRLMQTIRSRNRVLVLVDRSGSMGFPTRADGPPRSEAVARFFESTQQAWATLQERFAVETFAFDRTASPVDRERLSAPLDPKGNRTDIVGSIIEAAAGSSRKLGGVVIISDGTDNGELAEGLTPRARDALSSLGAPVSTLVVGEGGIPDLAVEKVAVDDFVFVRNTVTVEATLRARGLSEQAVPVVLKQEGQVVASQSVRVGGNLPPAVASFKFAPDQTGQFVYTVSVPVLEGEAVTTNNSRSFVVRVIRDRTRVLLVVGRPSWDERFLRGLLEDDPNVDLVSFFILRSASSLIDVSNDQLSLIPFPVKEIFSDQIKTFDVVIFQNFSHVDRSYELDQYLDGIRDYVLEGGALVMVGGESSFGDGAYGTTPLADVLPVQMDSLPASADAFAPRLTAQGARHPVTQVLPGIEANQKLFASLPKLPGLNLTRARPDAQVLLEDPGHSLGGRAAPVIALGEFGKGRSMAITTDGLWNWTLPAAGEGLQPRVYDRLWMQALRWLVKDPDLTTLQVKADHAMVEPGDPVGAAVTVRLPDYSPAKGATAQVRVVQVDENRQIFSGPVVVGDDGTGHLDFGALPPGAFKITATVQLPGQPEATATDAVAVRSAGAELSDAEPRPELMKDVAKLTGGVSQELGTRLPDLPLVEPTVVEVGARKDRPVWNNGWGFALIVLALGTEWFLRRRWGHF